MNRKRHNSPIKTYGALAAVLVISGSVLLIKTSDIFDVVSAWFISVNVITFIFLAYDKMVAGGSVTRIPEHVLIGLVFAGGSGAALIGMKTLRHKTSKSSFQLKFRIAVALQMLLIMLWYLWLRPRF